MTIKEAPERVMLLSKIRPAGYNPRTDLKPKDPAFKKIKKSLETFGVVDPLVWNRRTGNLVGGHQRYKVLVESGAKKTRVRVVDIPLNEEKVLSVALNKISGDWDDDKLTVLLSEIRESGGDAELTGFEDEEIDRILSSSEHLGAGETEPDDVPETPQKPKTRPGELFVMGENMLLCGDSRDQKQVKRLFGGMKPTLMVTDPPYGVEYDPEWRKRRGINNSKGMMGKFQDETVQWNEAFSLFPGNVAYIWHAAKFTAKTAQAVEKIGFEIVCQIIWAKQHFALSRGDYHWQHEPCWYAVRAGERHNWQGARNQSSLWEVQNNGAILEWGGREEVFGHGTQKPVAIFEKPILNNSKKGDGVYDPFCGSGTSVIAAERTGRKCFAMEIEPKYCDVIVRRWEQYTGKKARSIQRRTE